MTIEKPDVLVVGAGPSGLAAATALRRGSDLDVLVIEREATAGGIPRHSDHPGYGVRDMHTFISGPAYARRHVARATDAGARLLTGTMMTNWTSEGAVECTTPRGRLRIEPRSVLLATGARERPRPARMVPGGRPAGVYTTGELQNAVHLHHQPVGTRAVVIGGELVSWSAVMTLREAGCRTAAMVTRHARPESYALFNVGGKVAFRPAVHTHSRVVQVIGRTRVTGVEIEDVRTQERQVIECDTVVFTGDWIPDHELARSGEVVLAPDTRGPLVDAAGHTSRPGVFAAGNLVHPVDTADVAALGGSHVAAAVRAYLSGMQATPPRGVRVVGEAPFRWVSPGLFVPGQEASRGRLLAWVDEHVSRPHVAVRQGGAILAHRRLPWPASPGRVLRLPWNILSRVDPAGGDVEITLTRS